jgi:transposase-like protein
MTAKHSEAFIEQALVKVFSRGDRSVKSVAEDLNVSYYTLKYWMKSKSVTKSGVPATREKRPQDWTCRGAVGGLARTAKTTVGRTDKSTARKAAMEVELTHKPPATSCLLHAIGVDH